MPDLSMLLVFAAAAAVLGATPGPDMVLIVTRTLAGGRRAGFLCLAGVQAGCYVHAIAAALGLAGVIAVMPALFQAIRVAGAVYLLALAVMAVRSPPPGAARGPGAPETPRPRDRQVLAQGFLTNVLNPKLALFVLAFFPQFVQPGTTALLGPFLLLMTVYNLVGLVINGAVILGAGQLRGRLAARSARARRMGSLLMATVYAGLAGRLLLLDPGR